MIPLSYFLLAWFIFFIIFGIMAFISVVQMLRFGVAGFGTYVSTGAFLSVTLLVILGCSLYFISVDWQQTLNLLGGFTTTPVITF
ncbi:hypothetical protein KBC54_01450 [Patescibacteria group bacterium]|nr:hypothetical protein [Patescibacteria group bacterium]